MASAQVQLMDADLERDGDPRWAWYEGLLRQRGPFDRTAPVPGSGAIRRPGALVGVLARAGFDGAHELVEEVASPVRLRDRQAPVSQQHWITRPRVTRPFARARVGVVARSTAACGAVGDPLGTPGTA